MTDSTISDERLTLEAEAFVFLTRKYAQAADARQQEMGLCYTKAETHDLAKEIAGFALRARSRNDGVRVLTVPEALAQLSSALEVESRRSAIRDDLLATIIVNLEKSELTADFAIKLRDYVRGERAKLSAIEPTSSEPAERDEDWRAMFFWPDAKRRLWWISHTLATRERLNRDDLCSAFGVSIPQASNDIAEWMRLHPGAAVYDKRSKCYVPALIAASNARGGV